MAEFTRKFKAKSHWVEWLDYEVRMLESHPDGPNAGLSVLKEIRDFIAALLPNESGREFTLTMITADLLRDGEAAAAFLVTAALESADEDGVVLLPAGAIHF